LGIHPHLWGLWQKRNNGSMNSTASFCLPDERALGLFSQTKVTFLGNYSACPELERKFARYIAQHYLVEGWPIGRSKKPLLFFREYFKEIDISIEEAQALIDTTVSRARIFGQVSGFRVSGAKIYSIAGPDDNLICGICKVMLNRRFSVASAIEWQNQLLIAGEVSVESVWPLLGHSMTIGEAQKQSASKLQKQGFALPPFHESCRHCSVVEEFYSPWEQVPWESQ